MDIETKVRIIGISSLIVIVGCLVIIKGPEWITPERLIKITCCWSLVSIFGWGVWAVVTL